MQKPKAQRTMGQYFMLHPADCVLPSVISQFPELSISCNLALWRYTHSALECGSLWLAYLWFLRFGALYFFPVVKAIWVYMIWIPGLTFAFRRFSIVFVPGRKFLKKRGMKTVKSNTHERIDSYNRHLMPNTFSCFRCTFLQCQRWSDFFFSSLLEILISLSPHLLLSEGTMRCQHYTVALMNV